MLDRLYICTPKGGSEGELLPYVYFLIAVARDQEMTLLASPSPRCMIQR